jgi:hypothetical protein
MQDILIGVAIGFTPMLVLLIIQLTKTSQKQKEHALQVSKLKAMLTDRMDLESDGISKLKEDINELKTQNENLRISLRTYSQKPGRKEMARLQVYQQAADRLTINAPGFGAAWQAALKDSEAEFEKSFYGVQPFIKKVIPLKNSDAKMIDRD